MPAYQDFIAHAAANMPESDADLDAGGAVDETVTLAFFQMPTPSVIEIFSDNAADVSDVEIHGRRTDGAVEFETLTLQGTTPVATVQSFRRFMKAINVGVGHVGTITIRMSPLNQVIAQLIPGVSEVRRIFYGARNEAPGGANKAAYEKIFIKNNAADGFDECIIDKSDDASGAIAFALESVFNGSDSAGGASDRYTPPIGYTFDELPKTPIGAGGAFFGNSSLGIWFEYQMPAGADPEAFDLLLSLQGLIYPPSADPGAYVIADYVDDDYVETI